MIKTLLGVALQMIVAAARITIMAAVAVITLAGRLLAAAIGALWRHRHASLSGAAAPEPGNAKPQPPAAQPRLRGHRPRPFKF